MSIFTPLSNGLYSLARAQILIKVQGTDRWQNVGDCEAFNVSVDVTEIERWGKDSDVKVLRRTDVIQKGGTVTLNLLQATKFLRAAHFMSDVDSFLVQAAITDGTASFSDVEIGDIFDLGANVVNIIEIVDGTSGTPVQYVNGTHFRIDRRTGLLEITAKPATADDEIVVSFTAPAITESNKRWSAGFMQTNGVRCSVRARGQGAVGENLEVLINDVVLRPNGDIKVQGEDDYDVVELTGKIYADGLQPSGFEYGKITTIPKSALA